MEPTLPRPLNRLRHPEDGDSDDGETLPPDDEILPLVYDELRRLAAGYLRGERPGHTLQATAVVHEAFLRIYRQGEIRWRDRAHCIGVTAHAMRRVLVDHARERNVAKRAHERVPLLEVPDPAGERLDLVALDDALSALAALDERKASIVELHFFAGLTMEEVARVLGISRPTVVREWGRARAWLYRELHRDAGGES